MNNHFDFTTNTLIIGAGPAGSTLARKLAKNKIDTILVEKNFSFDKPCGGGIKSIVFDEFDLPKELETKQITKFNLITKKQNVSINLSKTPISIVLRKEFDQKLRQLAQNDGVILFEAKYINSVFHDDEFYINLNRKDKIVTTEIALLLLSQSVLRLPSAIASLPVMSLRSGSSWCEMVKSPLPFILSSAISPKSFSVPFSDISAKLPLASGLIVKIGLTSSNFTAVSSERDEFPKKSKTVPLPLILPNSGVS